MENKRLTIDYAYGRFMVDFANIVAKHFESKKPSIQDIASKLVLSVSATRSLLNRAILAGNLTMKSMFKIATAL